MPAAFDVSQLLDLSAQLTEAGASTDEHVNEFFRTTAGPKLVDKMREEVPRDTDDTYDSIEAQYDDMAVSVGPTNTDERGRPVGFFIEHGTSDTDPDPFVLRTSMWAEKEIPDLAADIFRGLL